VISRLLAGRSTLAIFPTGGGKSLCYQLPALALDGLTVVISPLIALMKDQIDYLAGQSIPAARLDSSLEREEVIQIYDDLRQGRTKLLYVSPERLGNERFLRLLGRQRIDLLAVDEAHCISEWGHNFRPDYLKIAALAKRLGVGRVLALTATATPGVADDIARAFDIAADDVVQTGFYRPNLELQVTACSDGERRGALLSQLNERPPGSAIVYVTLQRTAEDIASYLANQGFKAVAYHAGMTPESRFATQEAFMAADDMIVVATIAFGMGIDKANIRAAYHYNLPKSLESYMQEIGRAGRDGEPATCQMLACADDMTTLENFSYGDTPSPETVADVVGELLDEGKTFDISVYDLAGRHDARDLVVRTLLTYLELEGVLQSTGPFYSQFKFQPLRSSQEILASFNADRADFLRSVFRCSRRGKTWFTLDADEVARSLGQPRERIVAALDFLEQRGDLIVQAAGVRQGYRLLRLPADRDALVQTLSQRFAERERHDLARVASVAALTEHDGCLTAYLLRYFGEQRENCGHCNRCHGEAVQSLPAPHRPVLSAAEMQAITKLRRERHTALATPRQLTRFLCGLTSPATSRGKLRGRPEFGMLDRMPFAEVLAAVGQA
jgi:ATP-dependent DNA helicase RecQ